MWLTRNKPMVVDRGSKAVPTPTGFQKVFFNCLFRVLVAYVDDFEFLKRNFALPPSSVKPKKFWSFGKISVDSHATTRLSFWFVHSFEAIYPLKSHPSLPCLGPFINDVTQLGRGGMWLCDAEYEDVSKVPILAWQRGRGVNFGVKIDWSHLWKLLYLKLTDCMIKSWTT